MYKVALQSCMYMTSNPPQDTCACIFHLCITGRRSAVGNVSGNRCESDCRSRGRELGPGPILSWRISMGILLPFAESFKKGCQLQAKVCARSTACSSLPRKKCGLVN